MICNKCKAELTREDMYRQRQQMTAGEFELRIRGLAEEMSKALEKLDTRMEYLQAELNAVNKQKGDLYRLSETMKEHCTIFTEQRKAI